MNLQLREWSLKTIKIVLQIFLFYLSGSKEIIQCIVCKGRFVINLKKVGQNVDDAELFIEVPTVEFFFYCKFLQINDESISFNCWVYFLLLKALLRSIHCFVDFFTVFEKFRKNRFLRCFFLLCALNVPSNPR